MSLISNLWYQILLTSWLYPFFHLLFALQSSPSLVVIVLSQLLWMPVSFLFLICIKFNLFNILTTASTSSSGLLIHYCKNWLNLLWYNMQATHFLQPPFKPGVLDSQNILGGRLFKMSVKVNILTTVKWSAVLNAALTPLDLACNVKDVKYWPWNNRLDAKTATAFWQTIL